MTRRYGTVLLLILLVFVSLFAGIKLLSPLFFTSHDGLGHVIRMTDFFESFREGQIPVRISKRLDNGLGYPFYNFNYPLVYYLALPFQFAGADAVSSFKFLLLASFITGSISMYFFAREFFNRKASFVAAVFYIIAPYRFLDIYVRGNVGESLGLSVLPLFLLSVLLIQRNAKKGPPLFATSLTVLILVHNITAMIGFGIGLMLYLYTLWIQKKKLHLPEYLVSLVLVFGLTAFFTVPVAVESGFTRLSTLGSDYATFFPTLKEILYSPWGFGLWQQGPYPGKMSAQLGVIHEAVFAMAVLMMVVAYLRKRAGRPEQLTVFFVLVVSASILLALPVTGFLWKNLYLLQVMQMPWRFVGYATFGCAFLAGYVTAKSGRFQLLAVVVLAGLVLYANRNHISVNQYVVYENPFNRNGVYWHSTATYAEHTPLEAPRLPDEPDHNGDIVEASGSAVRTVWKSNYQKFTVTVDKDAYFRDNVYYYPGWQVAVDGKPGIIEYKKDPLRRLYVHLPPGSHTVEYRFIEPWYRGLADLLTAVTIIFCPVLLVCYFRKKTGRRRP